MLEKNNDGSQNSWVFLLFLELNYNFEQRSVKTGNIKFIESYTVT